MNMEAESSTLNVNDAYSQLQPHEAVLRLQEMFYSAVGDPELLRLHSQYLREEVRAAEARATCRVARDFAEDYPSELVEKALQWEQSMSKDEGRTI